MDVRLMPRGLYKARVTGNERDCERLTQGHECGVIRGEVMPQLPHPIYKRVMRVADDRQIRQIGATIFGPILAELPSYDEPA